MQIKSNRPGMARIAVPDRPTHRQFMKVAQSVTGAVPAIVQQTFSDPLELQHAIPSSEVKIVVTRPGPFHAELRAINFQRFAIIHGRTSLPLVAHTTEIPGRSTIFFHSDQDQVPMHANGRQLLPGCVVQPLPGGENHLRSSGESRWTTVHLATAELARASLALRGRDLSTPATTQFVRPPRESLERLLRLQDAASRLPLDLPDLAARAQVVRSVEQALLEATVDCLGVGDVAGSIDRNPHREVVMRRFERALQAYEGEPLYLPELCAEIGVSDRVLRRYCQERLGMGPQRYLWLRRMYMARHALLLADPSTTNVTEIATGKGFGELGRFAVQYRMLFGEMPSMTLRRPPERTSGR